MASSTKKKTYEDSKGRVFSTHSEAAASNRSMSSSTIKPSSSSAPKATAIPNLKIGSTGNDVKTLQQKLGVTVDGIFGPKTQAALINYQKANSLSVDGIAGPQTFGKLGIVGGSTGTQNQVVTGGGAIAADGLTTGAGKFTMPAPPNYDTGAAAAFTSSIEPPEIPKSPLQEQYDKSVSLIDQLSGRGTEYKKLQDKYNVPGQVKQLQELNLQIAQAKNNFVQQTQLASGKAIPTPFIVGEQTQIENAQAVQIGALAATAQALQGNIELAGQLIDQALEVKFAPIEKELTYRMALYEELKNDMTESEKVQATEGIKSASEKASLLRSTIDYALKAIAGKVPQSTMAAIANAKTVEEVYAIGGAELEKGSDLTLNQQFQATQDIQKTTQRNTEASRELLRQKGVLNATWNRFASGEASDLNATSQAIITTFNKMLDPSSVVRETEYDRSAAGQALLSSISGKVAALTQGGPGLTPKSLKELVDLGNTYAANAEASIQAENARAAEQARYFGLNPSFVTGSGYAPTGGGGTGGLYDF